MDELDVKISKIKNLNLIYLYNINDSLSLPDERKYLALKVMYDNNQEYISIDFKDEHFGSLIKKVLDCYNQEKDNRNIILLGDLTNELFANSKSFVANILSSKNEATPIFKTQNELIRAYLPFLKEVLESIIKHIRKIEGVTIESLDGYNKKFIVNISLSGMKRQFPIILYFGKQNILNFKIGAILDTTIGVSGTIETNLGTVLTCWHAAYLNSSGYIYYNALEGIVEKSVSINNNPIYHSTEIDAVSDKDISLINFYLELFKIGIKGDVIKTSDHNFIISSKNISSNEDADMMELSSAQVFVQDNEVTIKYRISRILNKLKHLVSIPLDDEEYIVSLKKKTIDQKTYLLAESSDKTHEYVIFEVDDIDLHHPFEIKAKEIVNGTIKYSDDIKMRLRAVKQESKKGDE